MQKSQIALREQSWMLNPNPVKVSTPEGWNAHLDRCIDVLHKLKVGEPSVPEPGDAESCDSEAEEPQQQLELDAQREETGGRDRMERGGQDRREA